MLISFWTVSELDFGKPDEMEKVSSRLSTTIIFDRVSIIGIPHEIALDAFIFNENNACKLINSIKIQLILLLTSHTEETTQVRNTNFNHRSVCPLQHKLAEMYIDLESFLTKSS